VSPLGAAEWIVIPVEPIPIVSVDADTEVLVGRMCGCGAPASYDYDPYVAEIHGVARTAYLCSGCFREAERDI
jgi:hypothetical protein